jgi:alpha-2-macroglobulin
MRKLDSSTKKRIIKILKSRTTKISGLALGMGLIILAISLYIISHAPKEKKISFTISSPALPDLKKQVDVPPLYIDFNGSVSKIEDVQKEISSGIAISPKIKGVWKWAADNQIVFQPLNQWTPGTEYEIKMDKGLFPKHIKLDKYEETFMSKNFLVSITSSEFHIDPVNEDVKQVIATIQFTHPVDPKAFESKVSLKPYNLDKDIHTFKDQEYKFSITYDEFFSTAYIISESLPIPEDDVQMKLIVEKGVKTSWEGNSQSSELSATITVPGMLNFVRIQSVEQTIVRNEKYQSEQVFVVGTKGKISSAELLKNMEVLVLPIDRPAVPGIEGEKEHHWSDVSEIGPEVRGLSQSIQLQAMESEHEYEDVNSFKMKADPLRYLYIKVKKGTRFYGKYNLSKDYESIIMVQPFPEQLEIMHDGIILSSTGEKKISIMSQGIKRVRFKIGRVLPDEINHLVTQSNGDLKNLNFSNYMFSEDNIVENYEDYRDLEVLNPSESNFFSFDFTKYLTRGTSDKSRNGIFFFEVISERTYTNDYGNKRDKRLIIVSDLGVLVKESDNEHRDLFVQSIRTGLPVPNAKVQVLGKNGIAILSSNTDSEGHVAFPSLSSFNNEKHPTAFIISKGDDLSFLPVEAPG